jgi:hypothetical protein
MGMKVCAGGEAKQNARTTDLANKDFRKRPRSWLVADRRDQLRAREGGPANLGPADVYRAVSFSALPRAGLIDHGAEAIH